MRNLWFCQNCKLVSQICGGAIRQYIEISFPIYTHDITTVITLRCGCAPTGRTVHVKTRPSRRRRYKKSLTTTTSCNIRMEPAKSRTNSNSQSTLAEIVLRLLDLLTTNNKPKSLSHYRNQTSHCARMSRGTQADLHAVASRCITCQKKNGREPLISPDILIHSNYYSLSTPCIKRYRQRKLVGVSLLSLFNLWYLRGLYVGYYFGA